MKDIVTPSGFINVEIQRANGFVETISEPNAINQSIRNKLATALQTSTTGVSPLASPVFDSTAFSTPTNGQSGIYIVSSGGTKYEMQTSLDTSGTLTFTTKGVVRAEASYTIASAKLGNNFQTSGSEFETIVSTKTFSSAISLVDGDQLTITWQLTIADN